MLVMTRRIGERIVIGSNITLTILSVQGNQFASASMHHAMSPSTAERSIDGSSSNGRQSTKSGFSEPRKPGALLEPLGWAPLRRRAPRYGRRGALGAPSPHISLNSPNGCSLVVYP
jgi:hypothetical protein